MTGDELSTADRRDQLKETCVDKFSEKYSDPFEAVQLANSPKLP
jgi:hypothetical protein